MSGGEQRGPGFCAGALVTIAIGVGLIAYNTRAWHAELGTRMPVDRQIAAPLSAPEPQRVRSTFIDTAIAANPEPPGLNQAQAEQRYRAQHQDCSTFDVACHLGVTL